MTLIDGDKLVTVRLYDDQYDEEFTEKQVTIIDFVNAHTVVGVTTADDVLDKIRAEIENKLESRSWRDSDYYEGWCDALNWVCDNVLNKYKAESEVVENGD